MMNQQDEKYRNIQKNQYRKGTTDHDEHNKNPDLWDYLFQPFSEGDWTNKKVLDFGCGQGRNIQNVLDSYDIGEIHGCDISAKNIEDCRERFKGLDKCSFFVTDGMGLTQDDEDTADRLEEDGRNSEYDAIFSTIVMQHIGNHSVRQKIFDSMFERLKSGGILSIQMGFGTAKQYQNRTVDLVKDLGITEITNPTTGFVAKDTINCWDFRTLDYNNIYARNFMARDKPGELNNTNGWADVRGTDPQQLADTLENSLEFVDFDYEIRDSFSDINHPHWIYFTAVKPQREIMHEDLTWIELFAYVAMISATAAIIYEMFATYG